MRTPRSPADPGPPGIHETNEEVLNDRPGLGTMGAPHGSGGARAAAFVRKGMAVIQSSGALIGVVDRVEGGRIWLDGDSNQDGVPEFIPISLIDGVDDARVILSERGDTSFGLGAAS